MKKSKIPLHNAVLKKDFEQIKLLVENGNNVNQKNTYKRTALHFAIKEKCSAEIVQFLLENGADVNAQERSGLTPLHFAAQYNNDMVGLLLEKGANPNLQEITSNKTPLFDAIETMNIESIKLLLEHGGNPKATSLNGSSALHWTIKHVLPLRDFFFKCN